jgi:hypothetical protein
MFMPNLFLATLNIQYENNYKKLIEEKNLYQLHLQEHMRRPAGFLHAGSIWPHRFSDYNADLFSADHGPVRHIPPPLPTSSLHA